ncbi:HNH endonuclease signature motif containing protein [Actinomadura craniellae]|uniref:HNH endonuclease signature motif containing protein n=1 Tax=Actinomadura craniellae TaxID=2231787 RepID=UPI001313DE86|nr:HNH endonuclease signature motif containing protein [Actinomadura craniellae]
MLSEVVPQGGAVLPEALAELPPGPELAAALALVDVTRLSGYDTVVMLRARARQVAHEQAGLYAVLVAVADRVGDEIAGLPGVCDTDLTKFATAEVAAALTMPKSTAGGVLEDAWLIVERLPAVHSALLDGLIDVPRAKVFVRETRTLPEPTARQVTAQVLPDAPALTTGQLAYRLRRLAMEADPEVRRCNYEQGVAECKVTAGTSWDGTAYLTGSGLPVGPAAAAYERVDAIARATKRSGDTRPMDQIRADVYLGLLDGTWNGPGPVARRGVVELTADLPTLLGLADRVADLDGWGPVIADIARQITTQAARTPDTTWTYSVTDPITGRLLHHGTTRQRPTGPGGTTSSATPWLEGDAPRSEAGALRSEGGAARPEAGALRSEGGAVRPAGGVTQTEGGVSQPEGGASQPGVGVTRSEGDASCPEGGAIRPTTASAPYVTGPAIRPRSTDPIRAMDSCEPAEQSTPGTEDPHRDFHGTSTGPARAVNPPVPAKPSEPVTAGDLDERAAPPWRDPRRFLTPRDRAYVIARDRTCRGPGCRVPARRAEIDHIVPHAHGGPTTPDNTDAKCPWCHDLKDAGWTVTRDARGWTTWISPLGHLYRRPPESITPPADLSPAERCLATILDRRS